MELEVNLPGTIYFGYSTSISVLSVSLGVEEAVYMEFVFIVYACA